MWSQSKTPADYERINYILYVFTFIADVIFNVIFLLPQYIYRKQITKKQLCM